MRKGKMGGKGGNGWKIDSKTSEGKTAPEEDSIVYVYLEMQTVATGCIVHGRVPHLLLPIGSIPNVCRLLREAGGL